MNNLWPVQQRIYEALTQPIPEDYSESWRAALTTGADTRPVTLEYIAATTRYVWTPITGQYWARWAIGQVASGMWAVHGVAAFLAYIAHVHTEAVFTGVWTTVVRDWALDREFRFANGADTSRKVDFNATANESGELYVAIIKDDGGADADVRINGGTTLVNELPLVGAARILDFYDPTPAFGLLHFVKIASGLVNNQVYAVTIQANNSTGLGAGKSIYFSGWGVPSGAGDDRALSPENSEVEQENLAHGAGTWEYAINFHPVSGGAYEWTGMTHGNEATVVTQWLDEDGNALVVSAFGDRVSGETVLLRQTAKTRHSFTGATDLADVLVEATFRDKGFDLYHKHTWTVAVLVDVAYPAMLAGEDEITRGLVAGDTTAPYDLTLNNGTMWGKIRSRIAALWNPAHDWVLSLYVPDLDGVAGWANSTNFLWIQDRNATTISKIYLERTGVPFIETTVIGDVWENTAEYRIAKIPAVSAILTALTDDPMFSATATGFARQTGSFLDDGFKERMYVTPVGFTLNTTPELVTGVTALTLTTSGGAVAQVALSGRTFTGGYRVYDAVPQGVLKPYIVIGEVTAEPDEEIATVTTDAAVQLHTWSAVASKSESHAMLDFIRERLDGEEIDETWAVTEDFNEIMEDPASTAASRLYHGVARYRTRVG